MKCSTNGMAQLSEREVLDAWDGSFQEAGMRAQACVRCVVQNTFYISHREAALAIAAYSPMKIR